MARNKETVRTMHVHFTCSSGQSADHKNKTRGKKNFLYLFCISFQNKGNTTRAKNHKHYQKWANNKNNKHKKKI